MQRVSAEYEPDKLVIAFVKFSYLSTFHSYRTIITRFIVLPFCLLSRSLRFTYHFEYFFLSFLPMSFHSSDNVAITPRSALPLDTGVAAP